MTKREKVSRSTIKEQLNAKYGKDIYWADVPNYEGNYMVSNLGHVLSLERTCSGLRERRVRERLMKPIRFYHIKNNVKKLAAIAINLSSEEVGRTTCSIARLVLTSFKGDSYGCIPTHLDGNAENNSLSNLKWSTYSEIAIRNPNGGYFHSSSNQVKNPATRDCAVRR